MTRPDLVIVDDPWLPPPRPYLRPALELELGRWEDDGGMTGTAGMTVPPPHLELRAFADAIAAAGRALVELARAIGRAFAGGLRAFADLFDRLAPRLPAARAARMRAAGRWHTDVEPHRWRDWQPSSERPVDRARRQRLARQLRRRVGAA